MHRNHCHQQLVLPWNDLRCHHGANPRTDYGPFLYKKLGFTVVDQLLIQSGWITVCFFGNIINALIVYKVGRVRMLRKCPLLGSSSRIGVLIRLLIKSSDSTETLSPSSGNALPLLDMRPQGRQRAPSLLCSFSSCTSDSTAPQSTQVHTSTLQRSSQIPSELVALASQSPVCSWPSLFLLQPHRSLSITSAGNII